MSGHDQTGALMQRFCLPVTYMPLGYQQYCEINTRFGDMQLTVPSAQWDQAPELERAARSNGQHAQIIEQLDLFDRPTVELLELPETSLPTANDDGAEARSHLTTPSSSISHLPQRLVSVASSYRPKRRDKRPAVAMRAGLPDRPRRQQQRRAVTAGKKKTVKRYVRLSKAG